MSSYTNLIQDTMNTRCLDDFGIYGINWAIQEKKSFKDNINRRSFDRVNDIHA